MSLIDQIKEDIKASLREGERLQVSTLRMLVAAVQQKEIDTRKDVSENEVITIIQKQVQQRYEAATQYKEGNRQDLFEKESEEAEILKKYLPEKLSQEETNQIIEEIINSIGATSVKDMGQVMSQLKERAAGKIDMKIASNAVREKLL